mmetsp:Transcript_13948/g.44265  ORF Transcript_13948/g.44265 Transcript_13948/m.44265 type:complete len:320 (+) Transcript_13948:1267-2226(+)
MVLGPVQQQRPRHAQGDTHVPNHVLRALPYHGPVVTSLVRQLAQVRSRLHLEGPSAHPDGAVGVPEQLLERVPGHAVLAHRPRERLVVHVGGPAEGIRARVPHQPLGGRREGRAPQLPEVPGRGAHAGGGGQGVLHPLFVRVLVAAAVGLNGCLNECDAEEPDEVDEGAHVQGHGDGLREGDVVQRDVVSEFEPPPLDQVPCCRAENEREHPVGEPQREREHVPRQRVLLPRRVKVPGGPPSGVVPPADLHGAPDLPVEERGMFALYLSPDFCYSRLQARKRGLKSSRQVRTEEDAPAPPPSYGTAGVAIRPQLPALRA